MKQFTILLEAAEFAVGTLPLPMKDTKRRRCLPSQKRVTVKTP